MKSDQKRPLADEVDPDFGETMDQIDIARIMGLGNKAELRQQEREPEPKLKLSDE